MRRISSTLRLWYELECGDGNGFIERDETSGRPFYVNCRSRYLQANDPRSKNQISDREHGAEKRLAGIMARHAPLTYYLQTDPRGPT